jgi:hypothetical protein
MNIICLLKKLRTFEVICVVLVCSILTSVAHASMVCLRLEDFPLVSEPSVKKQLEAHVSALPGLQNYEIRDLQSHGRFFMVLADDGFCKEIPRCDQRLLDLRSDAVRDVFAFRGKGIVWRLMSPLGLWFEQFQDEYSNWAFATADGTFIGVRLPRFRDTVFIDSSTPEETKWLRAACGTLMK